MSDYLDTTSSAFSEVRLGNVMVMLGLLANTGLRQRAYLRRRYVERATHFDATIAFLSACGVVALDNDILGLRDPDHWTSTPSPELCAKVVRRIIAPENPVRHEVLAYVKRFSIEGNSVVYRPAAQERGHNRGLRNFLMELGVVSYDAERDLYSLSSEWRWIYLAAMRNHARVRPDALAAVHKANAAVGAAAERAVVSYERKRIGIAFARYVRHVARLDSAAGYDIESVTIQADRGVVPRLIEVKAVSEDDYRFFVTANEARMAQAVGPWYYLYLVPVTRGGQLCTDRLRIICDPHKNVLCDHEHWNVQADVLECRLNASAAAGR